VRRTRLVTGRVCPARPQGRPRAGREARAGWGRWGRPRRPSGAGPPSRRAHRHRDRGGREPVPRDGLRL